MQSLLNDRLGVKLPIIQAPMAGVATPQLAAAVSNAGALGSLGLGASTAEQAEAQIKATQALTSRPFNVNLFCHQPARRNPTQEQAWIARLQPEFTRLNASPPVALSEIYTSFNHHDALLDVLLRTRPAVVSFHFGLPPQAVIEKLKAQGIVLLATATSLTEAQQSAASGIDGIVAQGYEAGGHRGMFDPQQPDQQLSTLALVQILHQAVDLPLIAAGGIMTSQGIAAALQLGAQAAQLGSAFLLCPEAASDATYREMIRASHPASTVMTAAISGRPARSLESAFTRQTRTATAEEIPDYPLTYALGKALAQAASAQQVAGYGAYWAGQAVALAQPRPAAELIGQWAKELMRVSPVAR